MAKKTQVMPPSKEETDVGKPRGYSIGVNSQTLSCEKKNKIAYPLRISGASTLTVMYLNNVWQYDHDDDDDDDTCVMHRQKKTWS